MEAQYVWESAPLNGLYLVTPAGYIVFDQKYGDPLKVKGLTIEEARKKLETQIRLSAKKAEVSLTRYEPSDELGVLEERLRKVEEEVKELREAIDKLRKRTPRE